MRGARTVLPCVTLLFLDGGEHGCSFLLFLTFKALSQTSVPPLPPTIVN